ncbi:hypothetical protein WAF17_04920 [Bernardetia sp. ABR2-2B]|uniref:hypothetical protein n=1 Tax=Bernardetia sp. ABR2-2B TaxID=3127472 RepID=UPI0030D0C177
MILLDNKYVTVKHYESEKCISYSWRGFVPSKILRNTLIDVLRWIEEYNITSIINDAKQIGAVGQADQEWITEEFTPKLTKTSIKLSAIIFPISVFGKISSQEIGKKNPVDDMGRIITNYFETEEKALEWIKIS